MSCPLSHQNKLFIQIEIRTNRSGGKIAILFAIEFTGT